MEKTFHDVLDMDREGTLVLPDFQRDFVWKTAPQQSLIATFLVQIPINGMLLLEGRSGDFSGKQPEFLVHLQVSVCHALQQIQHCFLVKAAGVLARVKNARRIQQQHGAFLHGKNAYRQGGYACAGKGFGK